MEKFTWIILLIIIGYFLRKKISKVITFLFFPKKYSLEGEIVEVWEEKIPNFIPEINPLVSNIFESSYGVVDNEYQRKEYYLKIKNEENEEKILEISFLSFYKIEEFKKHTKNLFLSISYKKYFWTNQIEILDLST